MAIALIAVTGAATDSEIIAAPAAGSAIQVNFLEFTVSAAATVSVTNGADGTTTRLLYGDFAANSGAVVQGTGGRMDFQPWQTLTSATALKMTNSAGNLKGAVHYVIVKSA